MNQQININVRVSIVAVEFESLECTLLGHASSCGRICDPVFPASPLYAAFQDALAFQGPTMWDTRALKGPLFGYYGGLGMYMSD